MKIAYLVNQYPKISHSFIRREILALEASGWEICRFSIRDPGDGLVDPLDRMERQKTYFILPNGFLGLLKALLTVFLTRPASLLKSLFLTFKVGRGSDRGLLIHLIYLLEACLLWLEIKKRGIGGIHAHFGTNSTTVAMLCGVIGDIPYSFTVHGPEEFDKVRAIALPEKIKRAARVVAIGYFGKSQLFRWCDRSDWDKIEVIRCGIDDYFDGEADRTGLESSRLVCVGRLCPQKGQLLLIEAANILKREGWDFSLVLVGDGELRGAIEAMISRYNLDDRVTITGWAGQESVKEQIIASRAMILPSFAEGLPVVLMESLSLGRPAVSTYVAAIPELIIPGETGWLIPAGSIDALVDVIKEVLLTPVPVLESMGLKGREKVRENHDINKSARKLGDLFTKAFAVTDKVSV